jgi:hypothetical protein
MDHLQTRIEALEQRTHTVERQLRWWRGLACGVLLLGLFSWALSAGPSANAQSGSLADRMAAFQDTLITLQDKLRYVTAVTTQDGLTEVVITGANLRIVNGLGSTDCTDEQGNPIPDCPNSLGNLIVGYNEPRPFESNTRTGSHNVLVGKQHNFSSFGGLVVGHFNEVSGEFASVSGGSNNMASGTMSAVHGGNGNTASGWEAVVSGGQANTASELRSVVSGGAGNTASGVQSAVSGGLNRTAPGQFNWVAGSLFADE